MFEKPIVSSARPDKLVTTDDEINDFLKNFANFKSQLNQLSPEEQEEFKESFNRVVEFSGEQMTDFDDVNMLKRFIAELNASDRQLFL